MGFKLQCAWLAAGVSLVLPDSLTSCVRFRIAAFAPSRRVYTSATRVLQQLVMLLVYRRDIRSFGHNRTAAGSGSLDAHVLHVIRDLGAASSLCAPSQRWPWT